MAATIQMQPTLRLRTRQPFKYGNPWDVCEQPPRTCNPEQTCEPGSQENSAIHSSRATAATAKMQPKIFVRPQPQVPCTPNEICEPAAKKMVQPPISVRSATIYLQSREKLRKSPVSPGTPDDCANSAKRHCTPHLKCERQPSIQCNPWNDCDRKPKFLCNPKYLCDRSHTDLATPNRNAISQKIIATP